MSIKKVLDNREKYLFFTELKLRKFISCAAELDKVGAPLGESKEGEQRRLSVGRLQSVGLGLQKVIVS